ncbi:hypothetical protein DL546_004765 [Coniochaeta pulveracea]|uniref:Acyltransferase 3 domain-containing protein n=1 Tax=Coniochaeta pulveracea TaxID=177199 RepID=A0A420YEP0_9PEZI|nr:hypothetical protein DL546_004765 [Coniochaeta pulveracea]
MPPQSGMGILDNPDWREANGTKTDWDGDVDSSWRQSWRPAYHPIKHYFHRIRSIIWPMGSGQPDKLRPTAYLDGLRGFAAFVVYWQHHVLWAHTKDNSMMEMGFGYKNFYAFCTFPIVRNFFTGGHFAVATFFVISGYVLSTKPLSLMHGGEYAKLGDNLASALFRRWIRLYAPLIVTTFVFMLFWQALWINNAKPQGNLKDEIWNWYAEFKNFSFIFTTGGLPWFTYNFHTWSIPVEMKGSIIIYTALLAFSRLKKNARLLGEAGLIYYFMYVADGWYGSVFMSGLLLCDLDHLAAKKQLPRFLARLEPYKTFIYYHLFIFAMLLGGVPSHTQNIEDLRANRGWYYLSYLKPQAVFDYKWFYLFWAAVFLVVSIPRIWWLKSFFETRFCQYLGRISYSLYLVHGPVLWIVGDRVYAAVGWHNEDHVLNIPGWVDAFKLPATGPLGLEVSFLLTQLLLLPLTFWLADLVTRYVDEPSVKFANWLYRKGLPSREELEMEARAKEQGPNDSRLE